MNNAQADALLLQCITELGQIRGIVNLNALSPTAKYLTLYALVLTSGTIEQCFKTIVADYYTSRYPAIANYLSIQVRDNSMNPTYENMCKLLKSFNPSWEVSFKTQVAALPDSNRHLTTLKSLVQNRNNFAHGKNVTCSFSDIEQQYLDSLDILVAFDNVVV